MINLLIKTKSTKYYFMFLRFFLNPVYNFFWVNFINLQGRIYFFLWKILNKSTSDYKNSDNNSKFIVENDQEILNLTEKINSEINNEIIEKNEKLILEGETGARSSTQNIHRKKNSNYTKLIMDDISEETKKDILNFASSPKVLNTVMKYLGVFPILARVNLSLNIPRENAVERGAMLWHKDDFGYKSFDLVVFLTDVNDENAPFYTIKDENNLGPFYKIKNCIKDPQPGERGKVTLEEFEKIYSKEKILKFEGKKGKAIFVDSFTNYHRGGFCKSKNRVKLRLEYTTIDSLTVNKMKPMKEFYNFISNSEKKNFKDRFFLNYLLFKRSKLFENLKIPKILMYIYRIFHFKHES